MSWHNVQNSLCSRVSEWQLSPRPSHFEAKTTPWFLRMRPCVLLRNSAQGSTTDTTFRLLINILLYYMPQACYSEDFPKTWIWIHTIVVYTKLNTSGEMCGKYVEVWQKALWLSFLIFLAPPSLPVHLKHPGNPVRHWSRKVEEWMWLRGFLYWGRGAREVSAEGRNVSLTEEWIWVYGCGIKGLSNPFPGQTQSLWRGGSPTSSWCKFFPSPLELWSFHMPI